MIVAAMLCAYAAVLVYASTGRLELGAKAWVILGASLLVPLVMVALAARRSFRLEGERLFVSGPFGLGGSFRDLSGAELELIEVRPLGVPSYRLTVSLADGQKRVVCTSVADRYPLLDALRRAMSPDAPPAALEALEALALRERSTQRDELLRLIAFACISIVGGAAWVFFGATLFG